MTGRVHLYWFVFPQKQECVLATESITRHLMDKRCVAGPVWRPSLSLSSSCTASWWWLMVTSECFRNKWIFLTLWPFFHPHSNVLLLSFIQGVPSWIRIKAHAEKSQKEIQREILPTFYPHFHSLTKKGNWISLCLLMKQSPKLSQQPPTWYFPNQLCWCTEYWP